MLARVSSSVRHLDETVADPVRRSYRTDNSRCVLVLSVLGTLRFSKMGHYEYGIWVRGFFHFGIRIARRSQVSSLEKALAILRDHGSGRIYCVWWLLDFKFGWIPFFVSFANAGG